MLAAFVAACADTMEADGDMNRDLDRVFEHAAIVDTELDGHASAVASAGDLGALERAETNHRDAMAVHVQDLDRVLVDMTAYCHQSGMSEVGRTHEMQGAMKRMRDQMEGHGRAPRPDLGTARAEEETHLREARGILRAMRDAGTAMRHDAGFYRCQHGNH